MDRTDGVLPPIPAKRYFTIGEVSDLCLVKPYVLRYWEQEFVQLKPMKRRGNRRYYQHHEVLLIRRIRELLYERGFTISGARNQLAESGVQAAVLHALPEEAAAPDHETVLMLPRVRGALTPSAEGRPSARALQTNVPSVSDLTWVGPDLSAFSKLSPESLASLKEALLSIRDLLS
jgi:DNA-binding transcriptional MerR regulator